VTEILNVNDINESIDTLQTERKERQFLKSKSSLLLFVFIFHGIALGVRRLTFSAMFKRNFLVLGKE